MSIESATSDREHRELARGLGGGLDLTCLVEAGAGTGKTSVLVDRLLAVVAAGTPVSRIVAITFTEKAAGELRVRFRTELEKAGAAATGDTSARFDFDAGLEGQAARPDGERAPLRARPGPLEYH